MVSVNLVRGTLFGAPGGLPRRFGWDEVSSVSVAAVAPSEGCLGGRPRRFCGMGVSSLSVVPLLVVFVVLPPERDLSKLCFFLVSASLPPAAAASASARAACADLRFAHHSVIACERFNDFGF